MEHDNVIPGAFKRNHLQNLSDEMLALIHSYDGRTTLAEVLGVMEIVKSQLIEEHK